MKKLMMFVLVACFAVSAVCSPVCAAGDKKGKKDPAAKFKKIDADGDGKVSLKEYTAKGKNEEQIKKMTDRFKKLDKDGDESLTLEEYSAGGKKPKKPKKPKGEGEEN